VPGARFMPPAMMASTMFRMSSVLTQGVARLARAVTWPAMAETAPRANADGGLGVVARDVRERGGGADSHNDPGIGGIILGDRSGGDLDPARTMAGNAPAADLSGRGRDRGCPCAVTGDWPHRFGFSRLIGMPPDDA